MQRPSTHTVEINSKFIGRMEHMTYTDPDVAAAVHTLTESILAGGISFHVEGMQMRAEAQRWYELHWYPWVRRLLRSLWVSGFAAVAVEASPGNQKYHGIPVVLDLSMLEIEQSHTLTGRPTFFYYDPAAPLIRGKRVRLRGVRTYIYSPPSGGGIIRSKMVSLVRGLDMIRTLNGYRLLAEQSRSDPQMAIEDSRTPGTNTRNLAPGELGTGMYNDLANGVDEELSSMAFQSIGLEKVAEKLRQRRLITHTATEIARHANSMQHQLQDTLGASTGREKSNNKEDEDGGYPDKSSDPRHLPEYIRVPRLKRIVHQIMAQAPTDTTFVHTTVSERVSSVFGIPPGLNGHRFGQTQQANNTNSLLLFVHTLNEWRRTIIPFIQDMYDWIDGFPRDTDKRDASQYVGTRKRNRLNTQKSEDNSYDTHNSSDGVNSDDDNTNSSQNDDKKTKQTSYQQYVLREPVANRHTVTVSMPGSVPDAIIEKWHGLQFISDAGVFAHLSTKYSIRDEHLTSWRDSDKSAALSSSHDDSDNTECGSSSDKDAPDTRTLDSRGSTANYQGQDEL
jgi:hypothetical protein